MERKTFTTSINAPRERVWDVLWSDNTFPQWTSAFTEGSRAETDWKEGSKVLFLSANGDGMVSRIAANKPHEFMSIEHQGFIKDGEEDTESDKEQEWAGAMENYTLKAKEGKTELTVEMDTTEEYIQYFMETWPKAMGKIKQLSESNN